MLERCCWPGIFSYSSSICNDIRIHTQSSIFKTTVKNVALILTWYCMSTTLSLYNKQLFGKSHGLFGNGAFPAPLLMSSLQFAMQAFLAKLLFASGILERTRQDGIPLKDYLWKVVPNGITTGLDIGLSNKSLVFITMSFYTMCKATVPIFLLFFAFILKIERPSWLLGGVVAIIVTGLVLLVEGEAHFHWLGFALVMTASCLSGLRFSLTQMLLHAREGMGPLGGPLEVLELLTPIMALVTLLLSLAWEAPWYSLAGSPYLASGQALSLCALVVATGAGIAFVMVWVEYKVIAETSALTFMIAGTCKEIVIVLAAMAIMGDTLSQLNIVGLVIVILGVVLFNYYKFKKMLDHTHDSTPPNGEEEKLIGQHSESEISLEVIYPKSTPKE